MDNIVIDASTGDVVVKTMIKQIMPGMHDSSVLKAVHRALKDYAGPKMSSRLINGRITSVANIGLCYDILDKMTGHKWDLWRQQSGQAFKQALRERVLRARSPVQMHETPPPQQQVATEVAQVETKASVLQKALRSVNINGSVRIDEPCGEASAIDVIKMLCPGTNSNNAAFMLARVLEKDDRVISIKSRISYIKINGKGHKTPVADMKTLMEIIWMLPCSASRAFRRQSADTICRVMGGDLSLCRQIEQNNLVWEGTEGGEAIQHALLQPVEYKEDGESTRVKESSVRDALASTVGGCIEVETPSGNIDVLSDTEVIEVKYYKQWKHGLGQVLAYQVYYPHLAKRVHLFAHVGDKDTNKYLELAKSVCGAHAVNVTLEIVELDLDDETETEPRVKSACCVENECDQLAGLRGIKRKAEEASEGRVYRFKQHDEPFWFEYASIDEKRAYASMMVKKTIALTEIDILTSCKEKLESVGRFDELGNQNVAESIRCVQRRFTAAVDGSVVGVTVPAVEVSVEGQ